MKTIKRILNWMVGVLLSIFRFFRTWNELIMLPIAVALWVIVIPLIQFLGPTATSGIYDTAVLQKFVYAIIGMLIGHSLAWLFLRWNFKSVWNWFENEFQSDLYEKNTSVTTRLCVAFGIVFVYFAAFIVLLRAI